MTHSCSSPLHTMSRATMYKARNWDESASSHQTCFSIETRTEDKLGIQMNPLFGSVEKQVCSAAYTFFPSGFFCFRISDLSYFLSYIWWNFWSRFELQFGSYFTETFRARKCEWIDSFSSRALFYFSFPSFLLFPRVPRISDFIGEQKTSFFSLLT